MEILIFLVLTINQTEIIPHQATINFGALQAYSPTDQQIVRHYLVAFITSIFRSQPDLENFALEDQFYSSQGRVHKGIATFMIAEHGYPQDLGFYLLRQLADEFPATQTADGTGSLYVPHKLIYDHLFGLLNQYQKVTTASQLTQFQTRGELPLIPQFTSIAQLFHYGNQPLADICQGEQPVLFCRPPCYHLRGYACCCPWNLGYYRYGNPGRDELG
jgi:hypothetical protein